MGKTAIPDAKRGTVFYVDPHDLVIVGYDTNAGPEHPLWTPEAPHLLPDDEMESSIYTFGVREAVGVRKDGDDLQVIKGRHRVVNARAANNRRAKDGAKPWLVPVMVAKGEDRDMLLEAQIENSCRVMRSPMDKAREAKRLLDSGVGENTAATAMGLSPADLTRHLGLFDLAAPLQQAVHKGALSLSAAQKLRKLSREEQIAAFKAEGGKVTARKAQSAVAKANGGAAPTAAPSKRQLKALIEWADRHDQVGGDQPAISPAFISGVRFAIGLLDPDKFHGLRDALLAVENGDKP